MKKLINKPEDIVLEMCGGIIAAHPELELIRRYKIIKKKTLNRAKVSLISGGGSGHEPAHAGFVGEGMLDAAVCGDVFASPTQVQVYHAIRAAAGAMGTLLIVKNYSGDIMNFLNAAHMAEMDGLRVAYIKVDDDIAVRDSLYTVGRRGVAGTVFVHKICGAAADAGLTLEKVKGIGEKTVKNVRSLGFALTSCTVPAKGSPTFVLDADEMEYGVGIHGEPGVCREKLAGADELAQRMLTSLLSDLEMEDGSQDEVAILVNGFGATPLQELYLFAGAVMRETAARDIGVFRILVGNYMTSIDMAGASLSVLKLDDELKQYLSEPCDTPALKVTGLEQRPEYREIRGHECNPTSFQTEVSYECSKIQHGRITIENIVYMVNKMGEIVIRNEVPFCELDSHAGDGDFGTSIAKGFKQLQNRRAQTIAGATDIGEFLNACALVIMEYCGGASGPIWGFAFKTAGKYATGMRELDAAEFAGLLQAAVGGIRAVGERSFGRGAVVGDKTLIDALAPCADSWEASVRNGDSLKLAFEKAAAAAVEGAKKTERIAARMGRAGALGQRSVGYPDAGAHALGVIFTEIVQSLEYSEESI